MKIDYRLCRKFNCPHFNGVDKVIYRCEVNNKHSINMFEKSILVSQQEMKELKNLCPYKLEHIIVGDTYEDKDKYM